MRALALAVHRKETPLHRAHRLHTLLVAVGEAGNLSLLQSLDAHLEAYPPHAVRTLLGARPWLHGAWPWNPRLPRPKPTLAAALKLAVTPTELWRSARSPSLSEQRRRSWRASRTCFSST